MTQRQELIESSQIYPLTIASSLLQFMYVLHSQDRQMALVTSSIFLQVIILEKGPFPSLSIHQYQTYGYLSTNKISGSLWVLCLFWNQIICSGAWWALWHQPELHDDPLGEGQAYVDTCFPCQLERNFAYKKKIWIRLF